MNTYEQIAINLISFRRKADLSREELEKFSGVDRVTIWRIEKAQANPSVAILEKLATALNIEVTDLLK